jgi:hypothetical protein
MAEKDELIIWNREFRITIHLQEEFKFICVYATQLGYGS